MNFFEARFQAQVCKFHDAAGTKILPDSLLTLMLMKNAHLENSQRLSVLASVAPSDNEQLDSQALQSVVKYENVASFVRSCDAPKTEIHGALSASSARHVYKSKREHYDELKKARPCSSCGQLGH